MGRKYSVICKNKNCKFHTILREGPGMIGFANMMTFRESILLNECSNPSAAEKLKNGAKIMTRGIYICLQCKEFKENNTYFFLENFTESPYGTVRYDVTFPFGDPICDVCNNELIYIKNILSSKVKCPKCDSELKARKIGYID
jgi:hypothetical protein